MKVSYQKPEANISEFISIRSIAEMSYDSSNAPENVEIDDYYFEW